MRYVFLADWGLVFMNLPLARLDEFNAKLTGMEERGLKERLSQTSGKKFT